MFTLEFHINIENRIRDRHNEIPRISLSTHTHSNSVNFSREKLIRSRISVSHISPVYVFPRLPRFSRLSLAKFRCFFFIFRLSLSRIFRVLYMIFMHAGVEMGVRSFVIFVDICHIWRR